jgi:hypothetical protein
VPTKTVLKVGFLEHDFERDHLAEKSNRTKMGQKIHCDALEGYISKDIYISYPIQKLRKR